MLKMLMRVLYHDDCAVYHRAYCYGYAAERHDIRVQPHKIHDDERGQYGHRHHQDGDKRGTEVHEKDYADERYDNYLFYEFFLERIDGLADKHAPVVYRPDCDPGRKPSRYLA